MKDGFIKAAVTGFAFSLGNPHKNAEKIIEKILEQDEKEVKILVFPELALSGCSCDDLFFQDCLLNACKEALLNILKETKKTEVLSFIGLPFAYGNELYNTVAVIQKGRLLGLIVKSYLSGQDGRNEGRYFTKATEKNLWVEFENYNVLLGSSILFRGPNGLMIGCEIGDDMNAPMQPAIRHCLAGAQIIVNPTAAVEYGNQSDMRKVLLSAVSKRLCCAYLYASAGPKESSTDYIYGGQLLIAENGVILRESDKYSEDTMTTELDFMALNAERRKKESFFEEADCDYDFITIDFTRQDTVLTRKYKKQPYLTMKNASYHDCLQELFEAQVQGLARRLSHINCKTVVLGLSGGLDSTLAILVAAKAMDVIGASREGIIAVTMPCFGTTDRTYQNACNLAKELGASLKEISIKDAVIKHFEDIGHDIENHDITYENAQARERTQVIMDLANQYNGIVLGTGDLSELALGWATYNGDLMSMYSVNGSVPKTVVRLLTEDLAENWKNIALKKVLRDILDTPVSPELLPPVDGKIAQKTEELVGPYELHDFFIYFMFMYGCSPRKIYRMAVATFAADYSEETILKWLKTFYRRFFTQQFKRSCMPDGVKVTDVGFSPRGALSMPSDAYSAIWLKELEECSKF